MKLILAILFCGLFYASYTKHKHTPWIEQNNYQPRMQYWHHKAWVDSDGGYRPGGMYSTDKGKP